jgi:two-component system response regulator NreC
MKEPHSLRVVVVGDTCVSEIGLKTIVAADARYEVCASAHGFFSASELIRQHRPDVLLIEPFLENRDGILWIKDLAVEFPNTRILIVSRQSERVYAERALQAGAAGYWTKNGSEAELMQAVATVTHGEIYTSPAITALAIKRFAKRQNIPQGLQALTDRELAVFSLVAADSRPGEIARGLGISRKTVDSHAENIKRKLGYRNSNELKRGAQEALGSGEVGSRPSRNL